MRRALASALLMAGMGLPGLIRAQVASVARPFSPNAAQMTQSFVPLPRLPDTTRMWTLPVGPTSDSDDVPTPGRPFRPRPGLGFGRPLFPPNFFFSAVLWSPTFFPYMWDSPWDALPSQPAAPPPSETSGGRRLRRQMGRLTREIMKLRYYQEAANAVSAPASRRARPAARRPAPVAEKLLPTIFVYRNGREFQVTDYAIFGHTLWVFGERTARKIPLDTLNLQASKKLNNERGVSFVLPD